MRLNQNELYLLFADVSLVNDIGTCKKILSDHLKKLGYKTYPGYKLRESGERIDIVASKPDHNMAIIIGRKYPRRKKIELLMSLKTADNAVFLTREGNKPFEQIKTITVIDVNMKEELHSRSNSYTNYKQETDIYGED